MRNTAIAEFGPFYPNIPSCNKYRKYQTLADMPLGEVYAYGNQVLKSIRSLNRSALQAKEFKPGSCPCPSGTWYSDGKKIVEAVRRRHRAELFRST